MGILAPYGVRMPFFIPRGRDCHDVDSFLLEDLYGTFTSDITLRNLAVNGASGEGKGVFLDDGNMEVRMKIKAGTYIENLTVNIGPGCFGPGEPDEGWIPDEEMEEIAKAVAELAETLEEGLKEEPEEPKEVLGRKLTEKYGLPKEKAEEIVGTVMEGLGEEE